MNDIYVTKSGMTKEQMFRLRLINGFNFAPIIADAIVDLSKDFSQNDNSGVCNGQILYLAISDEEGTGKSVEIKGSYEPMSSLKSLFPIDFQTFFSSLF